jgi:hypothetical protein
MSVAGYDEETSFERTLRKPEASLKEIAACNTKLQAAKVFDKLTTANREISARTGEDQVLLKVFNR